MFATDGAAEIGVIAVELATAGWLVDDSIKCSQAWPGMTDLLSNPVKDRDDANSEIMEDEQEAEGQLDCRVNPPRGAWHLSQSRDKRQQQLGHCIRRRGMAFKDSWSIQRTRDRSGLPDQR